MGNCKTYRAKSDISVNVSLENGKNTHVSFLPVTCGGSVFRTDNEILQNALERHYNFGKLFKLEETGRIEKKTETGKVSSKETAKATMACDADAKECADTTANEGQENTEGMRTITVACDADAKEYLADTYGISRTSLRSRAKIVEAAAANGIRFEGLG